MSRLCQKMINDMTVRGLSQRTIKAYVDSVTGLVRHCQCSPESISAGQVQDYILQLRVQRKLSWSSCNVARHGIRFLYRITLKRPDAHFHIPGAKRPSKLPEILNRDELVRLFAAVGNEKHRTVLMTAYGAGLRVSELAQLKVSDIDSGRMTIRVSQGKGSKDRYVPLSPALLRQLRTYWLKQRPDVWLFPGKCADGRITSKALSLVYSNAKRKAGIDKKGGIHSLRHCYATDLINAGVQLHDIQRRLGHASISSTIRYLHLAQGGTKTPSPLDSLELLNR